MVMQVECPSCRAAIRVRAEHAGRRGRCPHCQAMFAVPAPSAAEPELAWVAAPEAPFDVDAAPTPGPESPPMPDPVPAAESVPVEDDGAYALADAPRRAKTVKARAGGLSEAGFGARGVAEAAAPTRRTLHAREMLAAFVDRIEPFRPALGYRLWILIVAAVMVLLPLVYVALIVLVGLATAYHAVHNITILTAVRGAAVKIALLIYAAPLVAGAMTVLLMIKPLFARPARGPKARSLDPGEEPLLHAFVDGVCASVGAPRPARIEVDCQVNASAAREGGLLGIVGGRLILTIGLPLVAGLSLKQFAGVLAHEFGHFSQGAGMRLYSLIMRVNLWFARVVYQRDQWDETLAEWSSHEHGLYIFLGWVCRLAVWLARRVLWVLMTIGHVVSGFLSRQMEFDADRYQARMVGGACFADTMWQVRLLSLAANGAGADLNTSWQQRRLPDNYPKLVMTNIPQIPQEVVTALRQDIETTSSGLFDTHPCARDRIASARREAPGDGIFHLDGPATDVFRDFDALAKGASFDMYRASLGNQIAPEQLFEVAELVESQAAVQEGIEAAGRFFLASLDPARRLPLPADYPAAPADPRAAGRLLPRARSTLQAVREDYRATSRQLLELGNRLVQAELALTLLKADVKIKASDYDLKSATVPAAESARDQAEAGVRRIDEADGTDPFAATAAGRLTAVLGLLEVDRLADRVPDGRDRRDEARAVYRCTAHLAGLMPQLARLARSRAVLLGTLEVFQSGGDPKNQPRINAVLRAASSLRDRLEESRWMVGDSVEYPFEHAQEDMTLGKFAFPPVMPDKQDINGLLEGSAEAINHLVMLYRRALGRLAITAEEVERAMGLSPIVAEEAEEANAAAGA